MLTILNVGEDLEQENSYSLLVGRQNVTAILEDSLMVSYKLNILLPYDPARVSFGIYKKELNTYVYTKTGTRMFTAALFITAKTWTQPRCPSGGEWINQVHVQTMEYYSALKRNELSSHHGKTWRKQIHITEWKKPIWKAHTLCDILEKAQLWRQLKDSASQGVGGGWEMRRWSTEHF